MSSTQRSRAIAALVALVAVLALGAVVSSVVTRDNGDTSATGTSVGTPSSAAEAAGLQVNSANLRSPAAPGVATNGGDDERDGDGDGGDRMEASSTTQPKAAVTQPGRRKRGSTTVVKPPVAVPASSATTASTAPSSTLPAPGMPPTSVKTGSAAAPTSPSTMVTVAPTVQTTKPSAVVTSPTSIVTVPATTPTTRPTTTTTAAPTTSSTAPPATQPPASGGLSGVELEIVRLTNELRTNPNGPLARVKPLPADEEKCVTRDGNGQVQPVPALAVNEGVSLQMSRPWSVDMNSRNTMSHRPNDSAQAIYAQLGISPRTWGENVAWFQGYSDAQAAQVFFEGWRDSNSGHFCNLMSPQFTSIGVGVYKGAQRTWATQNFYATR